MSTIPYQWGYTGMMIENNLKKKKKLGKKLKIKD